MALSVGVILLALAIRVPNTDLTGTHLVKADTVVAEKLFHPALVNQFYKLNSDSLFWFGPPAEKSSLRSQLLSILDTAYADGLVEKKYHQALLHSIVDSNWSNSEELIKADRIFTDAAIAMCKDIYQGFPMSPWVGYDQLSPKYEEADNNYLLQLLLQIRTGLQLKRMIVSLEPVHADYWLLKNELQLQQARTSKEAVKALLLTLNYYRWIHHFRFDRMIIVNLPAARLQYFEKDSLVLDMRTVVGKSSTPTPRFATYFDQVILYPYWYVPRSITFNEYLPKIKANPSWLDDHNMQIVDGAGKVLDHHQLNWSAFHAGYFPYTIRQSTGCDNALGVMKFNIQTPYGVYLHDTNNKTAFLSAARFYSHGCIRLENPLALGNRLLAGKLDTSFLQSCYKEQKPVTVQVKNAVPVFAVYMPVTVGLQGKVIYYKDVYRLIK